MRKIKLLTLLALMLGSIVTTQAQEKQNDATWEETIEFLNKYVKHFEGVSRGDIKQELTVIDNNNLIIIFYYNCTYKIPLYKLKDVTNDYGSEFKLTLTGDYAIRFCAKKEFEQNSEDRQTKTSLVLLNVDDTEMRPRLEKAFRHLAYLATEKRKKEREASGDKF